MEKIVKFFLGEKNSIRRKLVFAYIFGTALPIFLITTMLCLLYYNNILEATNSLVVQNGEQYAELIEERMSFYESIMYELATSKDLIELGEEINESTEDMLLVYLTDMVDLIETKIYTDSDIKNITYISNDLNYVSYAGWYSSKYDSLWYYKNNREVIYNYIIDENKLISVAPVDFLQSEQNSYVVLLGIPVKDLHTKEIAGVLVMALDDDVLQFNGNSSSKKVEGVTSIIINENEKIITGAGNEYIGKKYDEFITGVFDDEVQLSEIKCDVTDMDWSIVNIIDKQVYSEDVFSLIKTVILVVIFISCIFFAFVFFISKKYFLIIQNITNLISSYKGEKENEIKINLDTDNELYIIANQFNIMTSRINTLVETLKKRNKDVQIATNRQKTAEIKALEAQINPHFLYNTLDSINWKAIENDEIEISNMLGALGSLLRYSVSNIDMVVLLEAEINWLEKYIFLQRERFQNSFDCYYDVDKESLGFPIYKMLLQPIIENILFHAFETVKSGGEIRVTAFIREDDKLQIGISDNGKGMEKEVVDQINMKIEGKIDLDARSIGVSNVINRMRLYYHDKAEIVVNSEVGVGTKFILIIPRVEAIKYNES